MRGDAAAFGLDPADPADAELLEAVHPPAWRNPEPAALYDLVVLGGGTAGLVSANIAASLGARVALVERALLGGDCLNVGCVPSKALLAAARLAAEARRARRLGLPIPEDAQLDFARVMERVRRLRARIAPDDSARRYRDEVGVDVFLGEGRFESPALLRVGSARLRFRRAILATGARAAMLPIPGLAEAAPLTNETVFGLRTLPERLAVIGAGAIGCELAQAFARLGARVLLIEAAGRVLPREEPFASERVAGGLREDGVELLLGATVEGVALEGGGQRVLAVRIGDTRRSVRCDALLLGVGRVPNVEGLGLDEAGIAWDPRRGVRVDDFLRTTSPRIYAAGDVCLEQKLTHAADAAARVAVRNALFPGRRRLSRLVIPRCTYTDPEVAGVGLTTEEAERRETPVTVHRLEFDRVHRALLEGEERGAIEVLVRRGSDRIVGATVVGAHAGETIAELGLALEAGVGLRRLAELVHPYPTRSEAVRTVAAAHLRGRLTPRLQRTLHLYFRAGRWLSRTGDRLRGRTPRARATPAAGGGSRDS